MNDSSVPLTEYQRMLGEARAQGLFKRTYLHYGLCSGFAIALMILSLYLLVVTDNLYLQIFNGFLFAFASVQLGMIGHDLSHGEVFASERKNRIFAVIVWSLLGGLSEGRWHEKHNRHHQHPNHIGYDPDVGIPFMFTQKQVAIRSPFLTHWVLPYQHFLFWLALTFTYLWNISLSLGFALHERSWKGLVEMFLILVHFIVLFYLPLAYLPLSAAMAFLITATICVGVYISFAFAPNHKGREELGQNEKFHWLHQITLTRNIYPSWLSFYLLGGLNFQIEHHLFPTMSRAKYWQAQKLVRKFCIKNNVLYHITTWSESLVEMHVALKREALRAGKI